jgi:Ricin-type beta-trefoil lectin domain
MISERAAESAGRPADCRAARVNGIREVGVPTLDTPPVSAPGDSDGHLDDERAQDMASSRARSDDAATPRRRRPPIRPALIAIPAGAALVVAAVIAVGSVGGAPQDTAAVSAESGGNAAPIKAYGGLCLDDQGAGTQNFNPIQVYTCNGTGAQQWTIDPNGNTIQALGKCLDVQNGGTADGTPVDLYDCNGTGAQEWIPQSDGTIVNPQSNKCLRNTSWSVSGGAQEQIWDCADAYSQIYWLPSTS